MAWLLGGAFLLIVSFLWLVSLSSTEAASRMLYGPEVFTRGTGQSTVFTRSFEVADRNGRFTLVVRNGEPATGGQRVTSAEVSLNGLAIFGPPDFQQGVATLRKEVPLQAANILRFQLRGQPGTFFAVWVEGEYPNLPPTADAGLDRTVTVGTEVMLDGSGSTDPDGDVLSYSWALQSRPAGSGAVLDVTDPVRPTFTVDQPGSYGVSLTVNDGRGRSATDAVQVATVNSPPVANAGPDQTATVGSTVRLDGTGSSDADGDALTWAWVLTAPPGSAARLQDETTANPRFVVDRPGTYEAELTVRDGTVAGAPDTMVVSTVNSAPVADAGPAQTVRVGTAVQLDGSGSSDVDGDALTYRWSLTTPSGSGAVLQNPTDPRPSFPADRPGTYVGQLVVHDGWVASAPATVSISTENSPPVADAGADRSAPLGSLVALDGSGSTDVDGDPLTYAWSFTARPSGSTAVLTGETTATPSFTSDRKGSYTIQLIVHDGTAYSAADTVVIGTENGRPQADAGPAQSVVVGTPVTLDGSGSSDPDGDDLTFEWSLANRPAGSAAALDATIDPVRPTLLPDLAGDYIAQLIVTDNDPVVPLASEPDTVVISAANPPPANRPPSITSPPPTTGRVGSPYSYPVAASDPDGDPLSFALTPPVPAWLSIDGAGVITGTPTAAGDYSVTVEVSDGRGGTATQTFTITVTSAPITVPSVIGRPRAEAEAAITGAGLTLGTVTEENSDAGPAGTVIRQDPAAGAEVPAGTAVDLVVSAGPEGGGGPIPPDPATVAPAIDPTVATTMQAATEFLYTGDNPIQTGVDQTKMQPVRAAVIRGKVLDRDGAPLSGVTLTILNHTEYGRTLSRADGMFDLAVNGGGPLTVNYQKAGFLLAQRQVETHWQDYAIAPDVILIQQDSQVTSIDLTADVSMHVAQGSVITDEDGTRRATLMIPQGTEARVYNADGTTRPVTTLNLRFTEYTVGESGPLAMPAPLPPTSAYTYAVELKADEGAVKIGGKDVLFDRPVPFYVDNFLGFPVGIIVPVGYYDKGKAAWIPSDNGKVIKILAVTDGKAEVDSNGDNIADDAATLAAVGITSDERGKLAELYPAGRTLWRVQVSHLSTWDCNLSFFLPQNAAWPTNSPPVPDRPVDDPQCKEGSIIECQNQILRESISIAGTGLTLDYASDRVPGRRVETIEIPLSGNQISASLKRIDLVIKIAGRTYNLSFPPLPKQRYTFVWDGLDAYQRAIIGSQAVSIEIGYAYNPVYGTQEELDAAFARFPDMPLERNMRGEMLLWQVHESKIGAEAPMPQALGAWTLSTVHTYDPSGQKLYLGHGGRRSAEGNLNTKILTTMAGNGVIGFCGDGGSATQSCLSEPAAVASGADGSLYIADIYNNRIRRIGPDGIITTVAGSGAAGFCGDGGPAIQACVNRPNSLAIGPDGALYIAADGRIRRVGKDDIITTVAGNGQAGTYCGDGGPATQACLGGVLHIAVGPDGSLYVAEFLPGTNIHLVRRVGLDGIISVVAGSLRAAFCGDGGLASQACLNQPSGIAVGPDGSLYIADAFNNRVRRVRADGVIATVAGNGNGRYCGDGLPATQACLNNPQNLALGADGSLYIADKFNNRIRRVAQDGIISTVAGNGVAFSYCGDGGPITQACLNQPEAVAVGADGYLYVADRGNERIRQEKNVLLGYSRQDIALVSEDGMALYHFDPNGRHLDTVHTITGAPLYQYGYDSRGRLTTLTDNQGNITAIERNASGDPIAIIAPFGQRTTLTLDGNGYLAGVTNPAGETHRMLYTDDGLLTEFIDPKGNTARLAYDGLGRLIRDTDPIGGFKELTRADTERSYIVTLGTALGRTTRYQVDSQTTGNQRRLVTAPDGTRTETLIGTDGSRKTTLQDGTISSLLEGPDPRFSMLAPLPQSWTMSTGTAGTGGVLTASGATARTVTLANPNDPLSLTGLTDTVTVNGRSFRSEYKFDAVSNARTVTGTSAAGRTTTAALDVAGRVVQSRVAGLLATNLAYDGRGRLVSVTQGVAPDERTSTFGYNAQGYPATLTDPLGRASIFDYDAAGRVIRQTLPDGRDIALTYDANGNVTSITPPGRPPHLFDYTPVDAMASYDPPAVTGGGVTRYRYDVDRNLTQVIRPDGATVAFNYDNAGRLADTQLPDGNQYVYGYDGTGKLTGITTKDTSLTRVYNGALLSRSVLLAGGLNATVDRTYDSDFRRTSDSVNGGSLITYGYDFDGLLTAAGSQTFTRSAQNGLLTGTALGAVSDTRSYNGFGELTSYRATANGAEVFNTGFSRDPLGRIITKTETIDGATETYAYTYDLAGRLTEVRRNGALQTTYTYDSNGNRLSQTRGASTVTGSYDDQDRMIRYGDATYGYTANGEVLSKTMGGAMTSYVYDALGNLRQATLPDGRVIDYVIDGADRRVGKKVDGVWVQRLVYDGQLRPIAELDENNAVATRFVYGVRANVPEYMVKGGVTYRILTDHLGSPRLIVNSADGTVVQRRDYDEFGNIIFDTTAPGFRQPFGFAGGLYDADTGLIRFGARDYDAETGRWTAKDPVLFDGTDLNLYGYASNDPLNAVDINGLRIAYIDFRMQEYFDILALTPTGAALIDSLRKSNESVSILQVDYQMYDNAGGYVGGQTSFDKHAGKIICRQSEPHWKSVAAAQPHKNYSDMRTYNLAHELAHANQNILYGEATAASSDWRELQAQKYAEKVNEELIRLRQIGLIK